MAVEYTINVNAITAPPIIGVEVAAGCGSADTKEEVLVQATEPTVDWIDGLWCDTSTLVTSDGSVDEVVVAGAEPTGAWEIWGDVSVVNPVIAMEDVAALIAKVKALELRLAELEQRGGE